MENMIDLINEEFVRAGYEQLYDRIWKHREYNDFWIVCSISGDYNVDGLQETVYNDLAAFRKSFAESEKSTSLLILQHFDNVAQRNQQKVIDDENNVYLYKKYVIQYTDDEWNGARPLVSHGFNGLGELLMQTEVFEHVKRNENSPFNLLYTVAHKLPFVMMHVERKDYEPNPVINITLELQPLFNWVEDQPEIAGKNPSDAEIQVAHAAIDQLISSQNNEQH